MSIAIGPNNRAAALRVNASGELIVAGASSVAVATQFDTGTVAISDAAPTLIGSYPVAGMAVFSFSVLNNHASAALAVFSIAASDPGGDITILSSGASGYGTGFPTQDFLTPSPDMISYSTDQAGGGDPTDLGQLPAGVRGRCVVRTLGARTIKLYARFPTGTSNTNRSVSVYAQAQPVGG